MRKIFIKLARLFGYEIIDQNKFISPTLNKELHEDLSILNDKSIILPLGNVKITKRVNSILIILRMNTEVEIWDQNKKRLFEEPKIEYSIRSINSLIKSIDFCQKKYPVLKIKTIIIEDHSKKENLEKVEKLIQNQNIDIVSLDHEKYKPLIKEQKSIDTFSNLASLLQSFEIGKNKGEDLIFLPRMTTYILNQCLRRWLHLMKELLLKLEKIFLCVHLIILTCI